MIEEDGTKRFAGLLDYSKFMEPKTGRVYQFKSRRLDFCRRPTQKDSMIMIIHFEGVIGDVKRKDLQEDNI